MYGTRLQTYEIFCVKYFYISETVHVNASKDVVLELNADKITRKPVFISRHQKTEQNLNIMQLISQSKMWQI